MRPMPSPNGTNHERLFLPDNFPTRLAMDAALPSNALAAGKLTGKAPAARKLDNGQDRRVGRDQEPDDDNVTIANGPVDAALARLMKLLTANLSPDDLNKAQQMIADLFAATEPNGNGVAQDAAYRARFPQANRLTRAVYTPPKSWGADSYSKRFPNAGRLHRASF